MGNSETTRFARAAGGAAQQRQCADCQQRQRRGFWNGFGELCRALIGREGEGGDIKIGGGGGERIALKEIVEREFRGENRGIAVLEEGVEVEFTVEELAAVPVVQVKRIIGSVLASGLYYGTRAHGLGPGEVGLHGQAIPEIGRAHV